MPREKRTRAAYQHEEDDGYMPAANAAQTSPSGGVGAADAAQTSTPPQDAKRSRTESYAPQSGGAHYQQSFNQQEIDAQRHWASQYQAGAYGPEQLSTAAAYGSRLDHHDYQSSATREHQHDDRRRAHHREEPREYRRENLREHRHDGPRDQRREEPRDQRREEPRDQRREEPREYQREEARDQRREETHEPRRERDEHSREYRRDEHSREYRRDEHSRDQRREEYRMEYRENGPASRQNSRSHAEHNLHGDRNHGDRKYQREHDSDPRALLRGPPLVLYKRAVQDAAALKHQVDVSVILEDAFKTLKKHFHRCCFAHDLSNKKQCNNGVDCSYYHGDINTSKLKVFTHPDPLNACFFDAAAKAKSAGGAAVSGAAAAADDSGAGAAAEFSGAAAAAEYSGDAGEFVNSNFEGAQSAFLSDVHSGAMEDSQLTAPDGQEQ
jgi:hypothetical protein